MTTRVQVVSVPVSDQERAQRFYVETLGFALRANNRWGDGMRWIEVAPPGAETGITLVTWFPTMPPGSVQGLVLGTDGLEAAYDALAARGVAFHGPVQEAPWGRYATFDDPDGNGWVLQEMADGDPAPGAA